MAPPRVTATEKRLPQATAAMPWELRDSDGTDAGATRASWSPNPSCPWLPHPLRKGER